MANQRFAQPFPQPAAAPERNLGEYLPMRARPQRASEPRPAAPAVSAITAALDRLEALIEQETDAFENQRPIDFTETNRRKSHSLLEITRLARALPLGGDPELTARLARLRDKLVANHRLLGLHLTAVREIADLMVGVLNEAESDGTYGLGRARQGMRP